MSSLASLIAKSRERIRLASAGENRGVTSAHL
jgi:hypothetical protein